MIIIPNTNIDITKLDHSQQGIKDISQKDGNTVTGKTSAIGHPLSIRFITTQISEEEKDLLETNVHNACSIIVQLLS